MSDIIEISTKNTLKWRDVKIDGHLYKVRNLGAGDKLDLIACNRESVELGRKGTEFSGKENILNNLNEETYKNHKEEVENTLTEVENILNKQVSLTKRINAVYEKLFDDGTEDQHLSKELVKSLGKEGVEDILKQIFKNEWQG